VQSGYTDRAPGPRPDQRPLATSDRDALKRVLPALLAAAPTRAVATQLSAALKAVIAEDFPARWPELAPLAQGMLVSADAREVAAGATVVLEMVRAFRCVFGASCIHNVPRVVRAWLTRPCSRVQVPQRRRRGRAVAHRGRALSDARRRRATPAHFAPD
jgi:hypothetical protein